MTRKDFELIAEVIFLTQEQYGEKDNEARGALIDVANRFADTLATTNPRFDRERFLKACGIE